MTKIGRCGALQKNSPPKRGEKAATANETNIPSKIQIFRGVHNTDLLIDAIRRKDRSYIRGAHQWLSRHPPNALIVNFLKKVYSQFGFGFL